MKYEVPVVYRGQCNFIVEANSPQEAQELAAARFKTGEAPAELGNEWEEVDRLGEPTEVMES
jgi:hypothetical protein